MNYIIKDAPITTSQITMTLDHEESLTLLRIIGRSSPSGRVRDWGISEKDTAILSRIYQSVSLDDKNRIGYKYGD